MADPELPATSVANSTWCDDFHSGALDSKWEFRGVPYGSWYHVANSSLTLRGTQRTLASLDGMALVTRKQDSLYQDFSVDIEFQPTLESHEAGIVAFVNDEYHNTVSVALCQNQTSTICLKTATIAQGLNIDGNVTTAYHPLQPESIKSSSAAVRLYIRATPEKYSLGYASQGSRKATWLTSYPSSWMAPHSHGRIGWHGARMGLYATGNGLTMLQEAVYRQVTVVNQER